MTTTLDTSEFRNFNNIEMRLLELELSWSFNPGTLKGEAEADTVWIWAAVESEVMKKGGLWVWSWSTRSQLCVIVSSFSPLSAAFCIIVGQKFSGDCTVFIAWSLLIYSSSKVAKKPLHFLGKCEVGDFYRLLNSYIAAWEIAECNEKWHAQCKIFSWVARW